MSERLSRRAFLGGAGAMVALPLLNAMMPRKAYAQNATDVARRLLIYYVPNGIRMMHWKPMVEGPGYDLLPILQPLAGIQEQVSVLSGLANSAAMQPLPAGHATGTGTFLTCKTIVKSDGSGIRSGISMDQLIARQFDTKVRYPSLQLGIDGGSDLATCDSGYSCAYSRNISWAGPTTPLAKMVDPSIIFDRLFGGVDQSATASQKAKRQHYKLSILDFVLEDAKQLQARLGRSDNRKLDEYFTSIRDIEQRLKQSENQTQCAAMPARPVGPTWEFAEHIALMHEMMVLAFQCDLSRVITFMFGNAASNRDYEFIGASGAHHELSHHQNKIETLDKLTTIGTWEVTQFAQLLQRLNQVQEGEGTLLDNCAVVFSSEMSEGNNHNHSNLPVLLAGRCGGAFSPGRHIVYPDPTPIANLYIALMQAMGLSQSTFGEDGTMPLPSLG